MIIARPNSDISIGNWTDDVGGVFSIYTSINESIVNYSNWIQAISAPLAGDPDFPCTIGLSPATTLSTGDVYLMSCYASSVGGGVHTLRWELLESSTVVESVDLSVTNDIVIPNYTHVVTGSISDVNLLRYRFTLIHDGTDWKAQVYQAELRLAFRHLDIDTGILKEVTAASGNYLELSSGLIARKSGVESVNALTVDSAGMIYVHS